MDQSLLLYRILSGRLPVELAGERFLIYGPNASTRLNAEMVYNKYLRDYSWDSWSDEDIFDILVINDLWDENKEETLTRLQEKVKELKIDIYNYRYQTDLRNKARVEIGEARSIIDKLLAERSQYYSYSAKGSAAIQKHKYLVGTCLFRESGEKVFAGEAEFWADDNTFLDDALAQYYANQITDVEFRKLARSDEWAAIFNSGQQIFPGAAVDLTDDQKNLLGWSRFYQNIRQYSPCPAESVITDDDSIDGWYALRAKDGEQAQAEADGDNLIKNEKIRNCQEVYLPVNTEEDAKKVYAMNSDYVNANRKKRILFARAKGRPVSELEMPDTKQELMMAVTRKIMERNRQ